MHAYLFNAYDLIMMYAFSVNSWFRSYEESPFYLGCTVGRCANRIGGAAFTIDECSYLLAANNDVNHLHGGTKGFDKKRWQLHNISDDESASELTSSSLSLFALRGKPRFYNRENQDFLMRKRSMCFCISLAFISYSSFPWNSDLPIGGSSIDVIRCTRLVTTGRR